MKFRVAFASALLLAAASSAQGASFYASLVNDTLNTFEDQDRESLFDMDGSGSFTAGDILVGYLRLDTRSLPLPGTAFGPTDLYAVFAQQAISVPAPFVLGGAHLYTSLTGTGVSLGPVTNASVAAYLGGITGLPWGGASGTIAALYESVGTDFIATAPGDVDGSGAVNTLDFVAGIAAGGTFDLRVGFGSAASELDDVWNFEAIVPAAFDPFVTLALLNGTTQAGGIGLTSFEAGLTVLANTSGSFAEAVVLTSTGTAHDMTVVNGGVSGASDKCFGGGGGFNPYFSGATTSCAGVGAHSFDGGATFINFHGFTSNADFNVFPESVPEPTTLALMGLGLLGVGVVSRRRNRNLSV